MARACAVAIVVCAVLLSACARLPAVSQSEVPGITASASPVWTSEATATAQPTAPPIDLTALQLGGIGVVVATEPLVLQPEPRIGDPAVILPDRLLPQMQVAIIDGPVASDGYQWYRVRSGTVEGWAASASREGVPWLAGVHNGVVAFAVTPVDEPTPQVYTVAADGSGLRQVTSFRSDDPLLDPVARLTPGLAPALTCATGVSGMTWTPTGDRLAFVVGGCDGVLLTLTLEGDVQRVAAGSHPSWSSDGRRLLFQLNIPYAPCGIPCLEGQGPWEVHESADGGPPRPVTRNRDPFAAQQPDLSPDGRGLLFSGPHPDGGVDELGLPRTAIFLVNADGADQRLLAAGSTASWSPNGRQILFLSPAGQVAVMNADGSDVTGFGPGSGAAWSPDGTRVAFTSAPAGRSTTRIVTIAGDGDEVTFGGRFAGWSPDGRQVLVVALREVGGVTLQRVPADGGVGEALVGIDDQGLTDAAWQPRIVVPSVDE